MTAPSRITRHRMLAMAVALLLAPQIAPAQDVSSLQGDVRPG